jgi:GrpB-like predicted nucleotidyltransferase (UPF0157 family)
MIELCQYDPNWPIEYAAEAERISAALESKLKQIKHIGSTSIPGICAKPIIDIGATVADLGAVDETVIRRLAKIGYQTVWHDAFPNRRFFRRGEWGAGTHHLHIYASGSPDFENLVLFRDHLRSHPESAAAYERLKRELAATAPHRQSYTDLKGSFIESVLRPPTPRMAPRYS